MHYRFLIGIITLFIVFLPSFAQTPPAQTAEQKLCALSGQVLSATTNEPLRKATVQLQPQDAPGQPFESGVDTAGKFEIKELPVGRYILMASRNGYATEYYGARRPGSHHGTTITLLAGQEMKDLKLKLTPHGVVMGRVVDEDGDAMAGGFVSAMRFEWQGKRRQMVSYSAVSTNDLGEYRLSGVPPGSYAIQASARREFNMFAPSKSLPDKPEEGYISTFYPGTEDGSTAAKVLVRPGVDLHGIDIRMIKVKTVRIRGKVVSAATGKGGRAFMILMARDRGYSGWNEMRQAVTDPSGAFEIKGVTRGAYFLQAQMAGPGEPLSAFMPVDVADEHIRDLTVVLSTGFEVSGTATFEGPEQAQKGEAEPNVYLDPDRGGDAMGMGGSAAQIQEDGTFKFKGVALGRYRVRTIGIEGAYLKSARWGDQDVTSSVLDLTNGGSGVLSILISRNAPQVEGSVQDEDGKPVKGATVVLVPPESVREFSSGYGVCTSDQYGSFKVRNMKPGKYTVYAWEDLEGSEYMDPEFVKSFEKAAVSITLEDAQQETLQLKAISITEAEKARLKEAQ